MCFLRASMVMKVPSDQWDSLLAVLSSLTQWKEVIIQWKVCSFLPPHLVLLLSSYKAVGVSPPSLATILLSPQFGYNTSLPPVWLQYFSPPSLATILLSPQFGYNTSLPPVWLQYFSPPSLATILLSPQFGYNTSACVTHNVVN